MIVDVNGNYFINPTLGLKEYWLKIEVGMMVAIVAILALAVPGTIPGTWYVGVLLIVLSYLCFHSENKRAKYNQRFQLFCSFCRNPLRKGEAITSGLCTTRRFSDRAHKSCCASYNRQKV